MASTQEFQKDPDFYDSIKKCKENNPKKKDKFKHNQNTNPRYQHFTQTHFTAGDEEQFETYRDAKTYNICGKKIDDTSNIFNTFKLIPEWIKYKNLKADCVINTFRYLFHKFKKGIFVKIADNELKVFLPFSKASYKNEWSHLIKIDPKYKNIEEFLQFIGLKSGYTFFNKASINKNKEQWYSNNCLLRYDMKYMKYGYAPNEGDSNINIIKNMLENLCSERDIPDIEFFINRRDFPLLKRNSTEPYNYIWNDKNKPLISHKYEQYSPILSMVTDPTYADVVIPTYEDWARVQSKENIFFPNSCTNYDTIFNKDWNSKIPTAVFRGTSTGCGVTVETNMRLKISKLSSEGKVAKDGIKYLDAGITKWNLRPRKLEQEFLQTIDIDSLGFGLVEEMSREEQSNYKYIINIDGHVSAFRISLEMNMGSVILLVESNWEIWYKKFLKPWVHYVPINSDLSDIIEKIDWCKENEDKCELIVSNIQKFYDKYLSRDGILDYYQQTLIELKKETGNYIYNIKNPLEIQLEKELKSFSYTYPETDKNITDINEIPYITRCYGLLQGLQWLTNFIIDKVAFCNVAIRIKDFNIKNKLSQVNLYSIANNNFIVKSTTDPQKRKEHIHDAFVGINGINNCLKSIPNFNYTYGFYEDKNTTNVITEYIPGLTLFEYINSPKFVFGNYLFILIQICLALEVAQKNCGLVHWDLTPWNIIIQDLNEFKVNVDYVLNYKEIYNVKTSFIPVIIDYGKSHIIYDDQHHGFINMFKVSTIQDVLTLLIKSVSQILSHTLHPQEFKDIKFLLNFISGNKYRMQKFENSFQMKEFLNSSKQYSDLITSNKYELESKTPLDLVKYILKLTKNYPILNSVILSSKNYNNLMNHSNSTQVFNYILSTSVEEKINTYLQVFVNLKTCSIPLPENLFFLYYVAQTLEHNINSVYSNLQNFLKIINKNTKEYDKIYRNTLKYIWKVYKEKINSNEHTIVNYKLNINNQLLSSEYSIDTFLVPEKILYLLHKSYKYTNLNDYKDIIEIVLLNNGLYKLNEKDKNYYIDNFKKLLEYNSISMLNNTANYNTLYYISKDIYSLDQKFIEESNEECSVKNKYLKLYKEILFYK
tara:strand:- start:1603 stop:4917 length:3315 start_codon:yes stop_codon:yes gene_type:complete